MTCLPSKVQTGACSSSSTRSLKCVPLALSSSSCSVRNESGLVRVAVGMSYLGLESKPYSLLRLPQSGLGLSKRCNRSLRRAQIVGGRDQNLQSANSRRNRNYVEQLNRFVHVHGE